MNANDPDLEPVGLSSITYNVAEYEPAGMTGITLTDIRLSVDIDYVTNHAYISEVRFPADLDVNCIIPDFFRELLIEIMEEDKNLMEFIEEACAEEYAYNQYN